MTELSVVGQSVQRKDVLEKVIGQAKYVGDINWPGMLYAKILRSPYPHARIVSIDTSKAEALAGVKAVVTGKDTPTKFGTGRMNDRTVFAIDIVRFVGEPVAAVAAESVEIAEEAVDLIEVSYEELPAVFDVEEALGPKPSVVVHPDLPNYSGESVRRGQDMALALKFDPDLPNVSFRWRIYQGDVERGFNEADLVIENRFEFPRVHHCFLEPHIAQAQVDSSGSLTVLASTQSMAFDKVALCRVLGLPPSKVRMVAPYVGGGFGGKVLMLPALLPSLLALKTGRPVRLTYDREEVFGDGTNVHYVVYMKDGVKKDGTLVARQVKAIADTGGYAYWGVAITRNGSFGAVGTYRIPNFKLDSYCVYTNLPPVCAYRGLGSNQLEWAVESQMDIIAAKLGMDAVEIRRKNMLNEGDRNVQGEVTYSIGVRECLDKVSEFIEWGKKPEQSDGVWRRGKGVAVGNKYTSCGPAFPTAAVVKVYEDGTIQVRHSGIELGQGCDTVLAQIAGEEFGVPIDDVQEICRDSAVCPTDAGTMSSRVTYHLGNAIRLACQDAKRQIFEMAAPKLQFLPSSLEIEKGKVFVRELPERAINLSDLFMKGGVLPWGGEIIGKASYYSSESYIDPATGQGERVVAYYAHIATAAEVAVNIETGEIKVLRLGEAADSQPINPKLCECQIEGGIGMGLGTALFEEEIFENGVMINPTFVDYTIPTTMDMPTLDSLKPMMAPTPHKEGPFGAKGIGEGTSITPPPAIASAVFNAVGIRIRELPLSREKVWKALKEAGKV